MADFVNRVMKLQGLLGEKFLNYLGKIFASQNENWGGGGDIKGNILHKMVSTELYD
jgi:hypothetical protein